MFKGRLRLEAVVALAALCAGLIAAQAPSSAEALGQGERNVLVILTDDQRLDTMEVMPATRKFFADGTRFSNAYATTPQCCPARASILSGKYSHNHGVESNSEAADFDPNESWPRILDQAGYRSGYFGKYLNGWNPKDPVPNFDESFIGFDRKHSMAAVDSSAFATNRARRFIRAADGADQDWAVVLGLRAPHAPRIYPDAYEEMKLPTWDPSPATSEFDFSDKSPALASAQVPGYDHEKVRDGQLRMLAAADDALKRLYRLLESSGELDDTLVVFMSDNGYYWGEHQLTGKALPYLDSLRIPMLVRGPRIPAERSDELVANIDVAPTILDFTNRSSRYPIDGNSLFDNDARNWLLLEGVKGAAGDAAPLWVHGYVSRTTHYFEWEDSSEEYYDLRSDPFELESELFSGPPPGNLATIRARVDAAARCAGASCP